MTLRSRLFALVSAVVAVTVVLVTWTVSTSARRAFEALDSQRTAALVAQYRREFDREGRQIAERLARVAAADTVLRTASDIAVSNGDYAPFVNDAAPVAAAQALDFLDIVAEDGRIISSAHWPARFGYRHAWALDAYRHPGPSGEFLQVIEVPDGEALALAAVRGVTVGDITLYLAGGRRLDRDLLRSLELAPGMRVLLYQNLQPELSRQQLISGSGEVLQSAQLEPLIARVRQSGQEARETIAWPDGPETVHAIPLAGRDRRILGVLLVGSSGRELAALVRRIVWSGIGFGGLGLLLGLTLSYVAAARVTKPVEQLADAARDVAGGNWEVRIDSVRGAGEVDALARAFETMTRELVDQRERLVQAERVAAWRELARRLAHELKNPLFPLRITLDNLRRAKRLPAEEFDEVFDESMATLTTGLASLNAVVGRFSDFARMPAPSFGDVPLNDLIRERAALFRAQLESGAGPAIALRLDLDGSIGVIRGDGEQLGRAVQNLLLNAIDAMPSGGELAVRTRQTGAAVRIEVADTGQGLTAEERERLFTPYYTTKQHGTGLGLAIVQSVVADHMGRIWVTSTLGQGATFHIELPIGGSGQAST